MHINQLQPASLWKNFANLNAIPRASKKEQAVIEFALNFGKSLGLETKRDAIGNVIIKKPATKGMENVQTVVLQSHLDMVHQKNADTIFDFDTQGIDMYVDGDWVRAKGTTLGADNGIGVAAIMAILESTDIAHPALEAMFTIDEETGMTGAMQIDPENFSGTILLNLDTEEEDEITIGCAGGIDTNTKGIYHEVVTQKDAVAFEIVVAGLVGGHSGMDIHKGRGNANKLMNRILYKLQEDIKIQLASLDGGSLRNAIPRESTAAVVVEASHPTQFLNVFQEIAGVIRLEFASLEPNLSISANQISTPEKVMEETYFKKLTRAIYSVPNGVFRMSPDIDGLVEASTNLARVKVKDGIFITQSLQRSSVESSKSDVATSVGAAFDNIGCEVIHKGDYPGWQPNASSPILQRLLQLYGSHFDHTPQVGACHAGLECGILGGHFPKMDMISFGPTIRGAHSPNECVQISSVSRFYGYLLHILREIPQ